ncbi:MAG TPA: DUF4214 domain-containing protein [Pirellulales bacterium]|nr:DUF4214 domain-containing protein [Pirellulales bacterium]
MLSSRLKTRVRSHGAKAARSRAARKSVRRRPLRLEGLERRTLLDSGGLDSTFGAGGVVTTPVGTSAWVDSVAVEPDGKIVAGGAATIGGQSEFALARYDANGSLDTSFGNDGIVTTAVGAGGSRINGLAVLPDGSIVAVGQSFDGSGLNLTIARFKDDGSLDASFGSGGIVETSDGTGAQDGFAVAVQSDGKIVVAGGGNAGIALVRVLSDGSLDSSFGVGGVDILDPVPGGAGYEYASGLAIQPDGKIVAVAGGGSDFSVVRVNANGSVDASFGENGFVSQKVGYSGGSGGSQAVVLQPDGKIVVGGAVVTQLAAKPKPPVLPGQVQNDVETQDPAYVYFGLARFNADGSLDTTFGSAGVVTTKVAGGGDALNSLALLPDGRIVAGGGAEIDPDGANPQGAFAAAIYNADGSLDTNFANGGIFVSPTGATPGGGLAAALDSAGDILIGGAAGSNGQSQTFALARVTIDSTPSSPPPPTIAFLDRLYEQFLGRSADAAGLAYWQTQIARGTSKSTVAADFLSSTEYLDRAIGLDYQRLLDRNPDAEGLAFFASAVQSGQSDLNQVAVDLLSSPEFSLKAGVGSAAWVNSLYTHFLGRSADPAGADSWVGALDDGSLARPRIAHDFVYSDENFRAEAVAWYEGLLGRAPTTQETAQVAAELAAGQSQESVLAEILDASV